MNKITLRDNQNTVWQRVSKIAARKAFDNGQPVTLCPVKMNPFGVWRSGAIVTRSDDIQDFEKFCNEFYYYNCTSETGRYVAFYLKDIEA